MRGRVKNALIAIALMVAGAAITTGPLVAYEAARSAGSIPEFLEPAWWGIPVSSIMECADVEGHRLCWLHEANAVACEAAVTRVRLFRTIEPGKIPEFEAKTHRQRAERASLAWYLRFITAEPLAISEAYADEVDLLGRCEEKYGYDELEAL